MNEFQYNNILMIYLVNILCYLHTNIISCCTSFGFDVIFVM